MRRSRTLLVTAITSVVVIGLAITITLVIHDHDKSTEIPVAIQRQLNFVPFITDNTQINPASKPYALNYDKGEKLLVYKLRYDKQVLTISQQATPQSFTDISEVYSQLIVKLRGEASFNTPAGTVNITYPVEYKGLQTAVMNSDGVLLFARPTSNMSTNAWQLLFDQLVTLN